MFVLELRRQDRAKGVARLVIIGGNIGGAGDVFDLVFAADTDGAVLRAQPTGPVARFELFELVSFRTWIEQDEIGDRAVELAKLLREHRAEGGPDEGRTRSRAA